MPPVFAAGLQPHPQLSKDQLPHFYAGKALADQPWVKSPTTTTARDGLGPLYNTRTCTACHIQGGRSHLPEDTSTPLQTAVVKVSLPGTDPVLGAVPLPAYGLQLQPQSVALSHQLGHQMPQTETEVKPEAYIYVRWQASTFTYPDGSTVELRKPELQIQQTGYGPLPPQTRYSLRTAPPLHGTGLLALVPHNQVAALADPDDKNGDGISGRINQVWNFQTGTHAPGRFGRKANRPDLINTIAAAFAEEMGITSSLFPAPACMPLQTACMNFAAYVEGNNADNRLEITDDLLTLVTDFTANLTPPVPETSTRAGQALFEQTGCAACHNPAFSTAQNPQFLHLSGQTFYPYTDLLLHDLGPDLADGYSEYQASGQEWRTAPLWGLVTREQQEKQNLGLLHDGRARTVEEAILWHGGEAQAAKTRFSHLDAQQRIQLIQFIEAL